MTLFTDVTFTEVLLTLAALGVIERLIMPYMPETLVGPDGMLLKTDA